MKAVVFRGIGDIRLEDVKEPKLEKPTDAIVRITASAICGTDLHMVRGTLPGMVPGTVLGHEGIGVVQEVGPDVRNLMPGDRVVIPSTIACGSCVYCRAGYFSQCNVANPHGPDSGTAFFGGPASTGPFHGMQAEKVRVPFAHVGLVKLPDEISDDDAILLSDIFPTAWFAAKLARVKRGSTVAVFGCGPVGQLAVASALLQGAGRVLAVDSVGSRLEQATRQGAEAINFDVEHPVETIKRLTHGIGVDRAIDAVGVDAEHAHRGPALKEAKAKRKEHAREVSEIAPKQNPDGANWHPGDAPSQALDWAVEALAKAGTLAIVGVYSIASTHFPIGKAMEKNLSIHMGNCNHRKYIPDLVGLVRSGGFRPSKILSNRMSIESAIDAYKAFDRRDAGWLKVELKPAA
ncbi:MAG: glutathione-dependent formaldehyde dehydrogenase [Myxococcaceae bacterium]|nr:glutathione-dependent formaldehyde dehydrogenase [Myxococcaceae bacterium]